MVTVDIACVWNVDRIRLDGLEHAVKRRVDIGSWNVIQACSRQVQEV